jgi:hypothetical protein
MKSKAFHRVNRHDRCLRLQSCQVCGLDRREIQRLFYHVVNSANSGRSDAVLELVE